MKINLLCDINWESRVDKVLYALSDFKYRQFFEKKNYGSSLEEVIVVFMCRDTELNFKRRIRFSKKEKKLYMDIMLDLSQFSTIDQTDREKIIAQRLVSDIPLIISKYKFKDFDIQKFERDLREWLIKINWL